MFNRLLLIAFLALSMRCTFADTPSIGAVLPGGTPTPPDGCKLDPSSSVSTIDNPTPALEPGKEEFSVYYFFLCPASGQQSSLLIWRTRHHQNREQLVGSLSLPPNLVQKILVRGPDGRRFHAIMHGTCFLRKDGRDVGRAGRGVNALLTTTSCSPIAPKHILVAWRVDGTNMKLIPVTPDEVLDCETPGPDC